MNLDFIGLDPNDKYVLKILLPHLTEDIDANYENRPYVGLSVPSFDTSKFVESYPQDSPSPIIRPMRQTARAVSIGYGLAMADGPSPVLDYVGFVVTLGMTVKAWHDYFQDN